MQRCIECVVRIIIIPHRLVESTGISAYSVVTWHARTSRHRPTAGRGRLRTWGATGCDLVWCSAHTTPVYRWALAHCCLCLGCRAPSGGKETRQGAGRGFDVRGSKDTGHHRNTIGPSREDLPGIRPGTAAYGQHRDAHPLLGFLKDA